MKSIILNLTNIFLISKISTYNTSLEILDINSYIQISLIAVCLVVSLYYGLIAIKMFHKNKIYLVLAICIFIEALYIFFSNQIGCITNIPITILKKIETILIILLSRETIDFLQRYFNRETTSFHKYYNIISLLLILLIISCPSTRIGRYTFLILNFCFVLFPFFYISFLKLVKHLTYANDRCFMGALFFYAACSIHDFIVFPKNMFIKLSSYGYLFFIIASMVFMRNKFVTLENRVTTIDQKSKKKIDQKKIEKAEQAKIYIKQNFTEEINRDLIASELDIHPEALGKIFKSEFEITISDYINEKRLAKASQLIKGSTDSITKIAYDTGFQSLPTFYRLFQKKYKISPTQYRENNK